MTQLTFYATSAGAIRWRRETYTGWAIDTFGFICSEYLTYPELAPAYELWLEIQRTKIPEGWVRAPCGAQSLDGRIVVCVDGAAAVASSADDKQIAQIPAVREVLRAR